MGHLMGVSNGTMGEGTHESGFLKTSNIIAEW